MNNLLRFKDISYAYDGENHILKDLNIEFEEGKFYTIIGPSGSGKSTFLALASGLDKAKEGEIYYEEKSLSEIGLQSYRNKYVSIIFQGYNLLNYMSGLENIICAMEIKNIKASNKKERAMEILEKVGLTKELGNKKVLQLSGGQQQRIAIARALVSESELIIADEPTGNLDENTSKEIINLIKNMVKEDGKTVIMVTHDKDIAKESDEIYSLRNKGLIKLVKEK